MIACALCDRQSGTDPRIIGVGVLTVEVLDDEGQQSQDPTYFAGSEVLPGTETRYRAYHLRCFEKVFREFQRYEQVTAMQLIVGPVPELMVFFEEDEGGEMEDAS